MNNLEIEIKMVKVIRKALSILLILNGVFWFAGHFDRLTAFNIVCSVLPVLAGILFLFHKSGIEKIIIRTEGDSVRIKWQGKIRDKEISIREIARIDLLRYEVVIVFNEKDIHLNLENL